MTLSRTRTKSLFAAIVSAGALALLAGGASCGKNRTLEAVAPTPAGSLDPHGAAPVDTAPKEDLRMVPPEAYMRTYLNLFGALAIKDAPMEVQRRAKGSDGTALFDSWNEYLSTLGFPDYRLDRPRQTQTNTIMLAGFEKLGIALCDRSLEHDWKKSPATPPKERIVFAFDPPSGAPDLAAFAQRFDVMHKTFLGYPAKLAPTPRTARFFQLYRDVEEAHAKGGSTRFTPQEAGWAAVCYGLVRHPEFHLY